MNKQEYLKVIDEVIENGQYKDNWESLCEHETPKWYMNDKFGIFIHWGVYSVPAYKTEWYARWMYNTEHDIHKHHVETYGEVNKFGYKDFIPMFRAEKFNADEWTKIIKKSGAKFVMPVAEHHDGFQMYGSDLSKWNAVNMGPERDILGELKESFEKNDLKFCASSHRAEHWWFYNFGNSIDSDVRDKKYEDLYGPAYGITLNQGSIDDNPPDKEFLEDWLTRTCELVDKYQPKIVFFDWWIQVEAFKPYLKKFAAYYYNRALEWGVDVTIDAKFDAFAFGSTTLDIERGQLSQIKNYFWQNDTSVAKNSWGYTEHNDYKKPSSIICDLVDVVSKNGALLLNIGPKSDGTIPEEDKNILEEIGKWLEVNGEAIFDTRPWKVFGEGPTVIPEGTFTDTLRSDFTSQDIRYTCKGDTIYAVVMKWPEDGIVRLNEFAIKAKHLYTSLKSAEILGFEATPTIKRDNTGMEIKANIEAGENPVVFKFKVI